MADPDTLTDLGDGWVRGEVRTIGDGCSLEDARRPDLPLGVTDYRVIEDLGVTMIVEWHQAE